MKWKVAVIVQDIGYERYIRISDGWLETTVRIHTTLRTHDPKRVTAVDTIDRFMPLTSPDPVSIAPREK